jgi:ABC-type glycerol-3-phosphate transport system permease component
MSWRKFLRLAISYGILILVTILISVPFFWFLITSLKTNIEYLAYPVKILPAVPQWGNYVEVFASKYHILKYVGHSVYLALMSTTLTIISSSMGGFAFSRFPDVKGRNRLFSIIIALLIVPGIVTMIPNFIVFSKLKLTNTYWPWVLWGLGGSAFYIFLFRQFFMSFPTELEEAAEVDGCGPLRVFVQIFLPNAKPALATSFIFLFSGVWGDYITPIMYLNDAKTTLAVKLAGSFVDPQGHALITLTLAACVLYTMPLIVIFFLGQQYILKGMVTSGLKG